MSVPKSALENDFSGYGPAVALQDAGFSTVLGPISEFRIALVGQFLNSQCAELAESLNTQYRLRLGYYIYPRSTHFWLLDPLGRPERIPKKVFRANSSPIHCFFLNSSPNTE